MITMKFLKEVYRNKSILQGNYRKKISRNCGIIAQRIYDSMKSKLMNIISFYLRNIFNEIKIYE